MSLILARFTSLWTLSDEEAMGRVQQREDAHAFAQLLRRWQQPIQRLCARMTGDFHRAEDLTQEIFARIYAHRNEFNLERRFSTFLWRVALNVCYDELRRIKRRHEFPLDQAPNTQENLAEQLEDPAHPPDAEAVRTDQGEWVRRALDQLPETHRAVLVLRHYQGLKFREIAQVLDLPEGTVKSRMADALHQLGRFLAPAFEDKILCKPQKPIQSGPM